jgi:hypothetical protein
MTRAHRMVHRVLWPVLALAVAIGFAAALYFRPPLQTAAPEPPGTAQQ